MNLLGEMKLEWSEFWTSSYFILFALSIIATQYEMIKKNFFAIFFV